MTAHPRVLVALADAQSREAMGRALEPAGVEPVYTSTLSETRNFLRRETVVMVICATHLADGSYHDLLRSQERVAHGTPVVVASRTDDTREYLEAMREGAYDYIAAPYRRSEVEHIVHNALHDLLTSA
jgi:DNA-binding NtrC family response regulator